MAKRRKVRTRRNPSVIGWAALGLGMATLAGGSVLAVRRWRSAMKLAPGEPTGGDTVEPTPMPIIPKAYVQITSTMENGFLQEKVIPGKNVILDHGSIVVVNAPSFPTDVVVSVPTSFDPLEIEVVGNAQVVAATADDAIVRVTGPDAPAFEAHVSYRQGSEAFQRSIPIYVRIAQ